MMRTIDKFVGPPPRHFRAGATLVELVLAVTISALLLAGSASVLLISIRTLDVRDGAAAQTSATARLLEEISTDLRVALVISERTPTAITFTVPDRDNDDTPETIRYEWLGSPVYQLTRQIDFSKDTNPTAPVVIAEDVRSFDLSYLLRTWGEAPSSPEVESDEALLMYHDDRPDAGVRALLVVTNPGGLNSQEQARQDLLEAWGYAVTLISEQDTQAAYDAAAANADVAYISAEVDASAVGDKLKGTTIGVINEKADLVDELGVATTHGTLPAERVLNAGVSTHHLTSAFLPGPVTLFTSAQPVTHFSVLPSEQAPLLTILGAWNTEPGLACLESGDELVVPAATEQWFGDSTTYSLPQNNVKQIHIATQISVTQICNLQSISLYSFKDKDARYALYDDSGGEPGDLIVESDKLKQAVGPAWNTFPVSKQLLLPGTYWLAFSFNDSQQIYYRENSGGQTRYKNQDAVRNGFLASWGSSDNSYPYRISAYVTVTPTDIAAGRRVQLPWSSAGFDINTLTSDGHTLMKRSLEWAADVTPNAGHSQYQVTRDNWAAQYFKPALPTNAVGWKITRVFVAIKPHPEQLTRKFRFRLAYADSQQKPLTEFLQETSDISANAWDPDRYTWYEIPFSTTGELPANHGICFVVLGRDTDSMADVILDSATAYQTTNTCFMRSLDRGVSWSAPNPDEDIRFYVYGKYITSGPPTW